MTVYEARGVHGAAFCLCLFLVLLLSFLVLFPHPTVLFHLYINNEKNKKITSLAEERAEERTGEVCLCCYKMHSRTPSLRPFSFLSSASLHDFVLSFLALHFCFSFFDSSGFVSGVVEFLIFSFLVASVMLKKKNRQEKGEREKRAR